MKCAIRYAAIGIRQIGIGLMSTVVHSCDVLNGLFCSTLGLVLFHADLHLSFDHTVHFQPSFFYFRREFFLKNVLQCAYQDSSYNLITLIYNKEYYLTSLVVRYSQKIGKNNIYIQNYRKSLQIWALINGVAHFKRYFWTFLIDMYCSIWQHFKEFNKLVLAIYNFGNKSFFIDQIIERNAVKT